MPPKTLKQRTKQQKENYCENINEEFCQRAFSLFFSFYENPSIEEINTFPPVKPDPTKNTKKKNNIQKSIIDLRLKRLQEQKQTEAKQIVEEIEDNIIEMADTLRGSDINLDQVFLPEPAQRPEKPKYLINQEKDIEASRRRERPRSEGINIIATQEKFQKKLDDSAKRGIERAQKRIQQLSRGGKIQLTKASARQKENPKQISNETRQVQNEIRKTQNETRQTQNETRQTQNETRQTQNETRQALKTKLQYKSSVRYFPQN